MLRVLNCIWRQGSYRAPKVDMSGKSVVLTGPTPGGIGYEAAKGLGDFGASLILGARNLETAQAVADEIAGSKLLRCDLADPQSVAAFAEQVLAELGAPPDVLLCNAGVVTRRYEETAGGVEKTFRICALGHFDLIRRLKPRRTVWVTGEIYVLAKGPADPFLKHGGQEAYNRACLARLQLLRELKERARAAGEPAEFIAVHPGVVSTGLMGASGLTKKIAGSLLITPQLGAQASLLAASVSSDVPHLSDPLPYFGNKRGWHVLDPSDAAMDTEAGKKLYEVCEKLVDGE